MAVRKNPKSKSKTVANGASARGKTLAPARAPEADPSPKAAVAVDAAAERKSPWDTAFLKRPAVLDATGTAVKADAPLPSRDRGGYDGDTAFKLYLREIGQVKLLTPQEEIELAAKIKKGDKKAREQMIKANLRLVVKIAHDYEGFGLPLLDLISEGNIGLMKAVERFDPSKGGKLSTYGSWWIKQSIKRALANQSKQSVLQLLR